MPKAKGVLGNPSAVGFRVKSGWATAVLLAGPVDKPRAVDRCVIELSDPQFPETRQPYHASTGREETDAIKVRRRLKTVERVTDHSVRKLIERYRSLAGRLRGAALVVGSVIKPDSIANPHIRAHAHEGELFRTVLQNSLDARGLHCRVVVERKAYVHAASVLERSEPELKRALVAIGRPIGPPWGANEKLATLGAWMALA